MKKNRVGQAREIRGTVKSVKSKRSTVPYYRVQIVCQDTGEFLQTDIVPSFRNFAKWKGLLVEGYLLGGMRLIKEGKIDADGGAHLIRKAAPPPKQKMLF